MEQEIKAAAKWWADCLRTPKRHNNGDSLHNGMMALLMERSAPIEADKIDRFQEELEKSLRGRTRDWISVDYGPDITLTDACGRAEIEDIGYRFPVKTCMWINPGEVKVSCGYRAPEEILYKEDSGQSKS